ncbi:MAG: 50S ribosomal protein L18 [Oscillospiraceae bacterium]|nr:50S ribosomal protein L18 [Oscillospiraceae bacterium]
MLKKVDSNVARCKRHERIRSKVFGTNERPRLNVYKSKSNIYAQIINDEEGITLVSSSTLDKSFSAPNGSNKEAAQIVGKNLAEVAIKKNIKTVVFDRGGYLYHGRVKSLAEGAREGGLVF